MATTSDVRQNPERPPEQWVTRDEPLTGPQESWSGPNIATLAIDGTGAVVAYRKMWPGAAEAKRFAPGPEPAVLDVNGWRLGLAICKDTDVRQHAADTAALGIDVYLASTVNEPQENVRPDPKVPTWMRTIVHSRSSVNFSHCRRGNRQWCCVGNGPDGPTQDASTRPAWPSGRPTHWRDRRPCVLTHTKARFQSLAACADKIQSYRDTGDPFCAGGLNIAAHLDYTTKYNAAAATFVKARLAGTAVVGSANPAATEAPAGTPTSAAAGSLGCLAGASLVDDLTSLFG